MKRIKQRTQAVSNSPKKDIRPFTLTNRIKSMTLEILGKSTKIEKNGANTKLTNKRTSGGLMVIEQIELYTHVFLPVVEEENVTKITLLLFLIYFTNF